MKDTESKHNHKYSFFFYENQPSYSIITVWFVYGQVGVVTVPLDKQGYIKVQWNKNNYSNFYRMGYQNKYDLYRLAGMTQTNTTCTGLQV